MTHENINIRSTWYAPDTSWTATNTHNNDDNDNDSGNTNSNINDENDHNVNLTGKFSNPWWNPSRSRPLRENRTTENRMHAMPEDHLGCINT